jgi:hypothetical protein
MSNKVCSSQLPKRTKDMTKYYLKNDLILQSIVLDSDNIYSSIEYFTTDIPTIEKVEIITQ